MPSLFPVTAGFRPRPSLLLLGAMCAALSSAYAQQQAPLAPQVTPRDLRPDTPPKPAASLPQQVVASEIPPNADNLFVRLGDVKLEGGFDELDSASEELIAPLRGQRISVAAFYHLGDALENLYREAGYPLVRVVIPPQTVTDDAPLRMVVLDGFIERVDTQALPARTRQRVQQLTDGLVGRRHLRNQDLERALTLAGRAPGLNLRSALGAGSSAGATVLVLDGELSLFGASLSADNRLSEAMGKWQDTLQVRLNQPFGLGEQLYMYVSGGTHLRDAGHTEAPRRVGGGGLILPLGDNGLSLNPEFTISDTKPRTAFALLQSRSQLERLTLRLIYPLLVTRAEELTLTAVADASRQTDTLPNFGYTLDIDRLRVGRVTLDWRRAAGPGQLRASTTYSRGTPLAGARSNDEMASSGIPMSRAGAESGFAKLEATLDYSMALPLGVQARSIMRGQLALSGVMPSAELFSMDGEDALSTFQSGSLSNDGGWTARQEFSRPLAAGPVGVEPYGFAAAGKATTRVHLGTVSPLLEDAYGIGLRLSWKNCSLAAEFGHRRLRPAGINETQSTFKAQVQF
ncbi:ShlB/FhaC/HecB family hemolysin secretion/activation protein [Duganella levis]|uniref:ShlB/FhaC/HecB family hemolysin secretion/activation protein n=1 Tax=Duganella levis TaxID=2692169 RepID=A0ABW9W3J5_9BURK|nr:ShlB/FhaC/HecB family hemolysin secretion/activation protein [Duganella levis]MYN28486.1 hypothetical protein [Duganella levis]